MSFDPQFTVDASLAPTFTLKKFNKEDGTFEIHFSSPELKAESYPPIAYSIHNLKTEEEEPVLFQIAQIVFWEVEKIKKLEADKRGTVAAITGLMNTELSVSPEDMNRHRERMFKQNVTTVEPVLNVTQVVNVHDENDFNAQFEAASKAAAEEG